MAGYSHCAGFAFLRHFCQFAVNSRHLQGTAKVAGESGEGERREGVVEESQQRWLVTFATTRFPLTDNLFACWLRLLLLSKKSNPHQRSTHTPPPPFLTLSLSFFYLAILFISIFMCRTRRRRHAFILLRISLLSPHSNSHTHTLTHVYIHIWYIHVCMWSCCQVVLSAPLAFRTRHDSLPIVL